MRRAAKLRTVMAKCHTNFVQLIGGEVGAEGSKAASCHGKVSY